MENLGAGYEDFKDFIASSAIDIYKDEEDEDVKLNKTNELLGFMDALDPHNFSLYVKNNFKEVNSSNVDRVLRKIILLYKPLYEL